MTQDIKRLLDDLYALDPSLRAKEAELVPLLTQLLRAKPNAEVDENFAFVLRNKLMSANPVQTKPFFARIPMAAALGVLGLAIAVPAAYFLSNGTPSSDVTTVAYSTLGTRAFGDLTLANGAGGRGGVATAAADESTASTLSMNAGGFGGGGVASDAKMIAPGEMYPGTLYTYSYDGDVSLPSSPGTVYRMSSLVSLPSITNANLGVVDLSKFGNLQTQYVTLRQDDPNGYTVSIDTTYGNISINPNEGFWTRYTDGAGTLSASQIPSNDAIIATAASFLDSFGVDRSAYGEARIDSSTMARILASAERGDSYVEEYVTVSWPLMIDGKPVLNSDGSARGISASVNIRLNKVTWASIIAPTALEGSSYELETDTSRIMDIVERGGLYAWAGSEATKTVDIGLAAPELVYTTHSHYDESTGRYTELFVPALYFGIDDVPEGETVYQQAIVVPIVSEILDSAPEQPVYRILEDEKLIGGDAVDPDATTSSSDAVKAEEAAE